MLEETDGKNNTPTIVYKNLFCELLDKYKCCNHIYTDGSTLKGNKGCAVIWNDRELLFKLLDAFTIFSNEVFALNKAIDTIIENKLAKSVIFTDSKSTLEALKDRLNKNTRFHNLLRKIQMIANQGNDIVLGWIPSHQGLAGNERADKAAKKATSEGSDHSTEPITIDEFKILITQYMWSMCDSRWKQKTSVLHCVRQDV